MTPPSWIVRATGLLFVLATLVCRAAVVTAGAGSYLTTPPKPCKPLPEAMYRTTGLKGPMVTGQWWSSLVWQKYSQNLFAHPLVMLCTSNGLAVSYPGAKIHGTKAGIFGEGFPRTGDLMIGHSAAPSFPQADCGGFSDWFVTAVFAEGTAELRTSFGHGSPFVYCLYSNGNPTVSFARRPEVWAGKAADAVLAVTVNGHHYALFGASGSTWSGLEGNRFTNSANGKAYFSIALLPDNTPETLALFRKYAYSHVTHTRVEYNVRPRVVSTTYRFITEQHEGTEKGTIFALYPHQEMEGTLQITTTLSYDSVRGTMRVTTGERYGTATAIQGLLPMLPREGVQDRARMLGYLQAEADKKRPGFGDTYWEGKYLGRLATLSGIAEAADAPELQKVFVEEIKRRLENWFTATPGKEQPVFYYNAMWGTLIGSRPSYGSDRPLNDHHFHYGYFIRAAAEVARLDPAWAAKWGPMVKLLIRDIASGDRNDPLFPFLRCFDKYAGHSWASGDANFADGNNQESSSESLNAWYGLILWGLASDDRATRDLGLYLFNTERIAMANYWFDVTGTTFPKDFPEVALGMVWGGKGAFATWFSGDIDCIHGINWLPFTPASLYMGRWPTYVKKNYDRIVERRKGGTDFNTGWGDLVVMFGALENPSRAAEWIDANPNCKVEGGNSHAFTYHWIYTLQNLGQPDTSVPFYSDYPAAAVFNKAGKKTYAAYNYSPAPLTVNFSDGTTLIAQPRAMTVKKQP